VIDLFIRNVLISQSSVIDNLDCLEERLKGLGINVSTVPELQKLVRLSGIPVRTLNIQGIEGLTLWLLSHDVIGSPHMNSKFDNLEISQCSSILEELLINKKHHLSLDNLGLYKLPGLKEIIWKRVEPEYVLPKLRVVNIHSCHELNHVARVVNLPCLEHLFWRFVKIWSMWFWKKQGRSKKCIGLPFLT